jgi:hypothetical protein
LLHELGLHIGATQVEIVDFNQAEGCYIHHTRAPVALTGFALVSPSFARGRFPKFTFLNLINKRPAMDEKEVCAFAAVCSIKVTPPFWNNPQPFDNHLTSMIDKYGLGTFFQRAEPKIQGISWSTCSKTPDKFKQWCSDYRKLPPVRQLLVATVLGLYGQYDAHNTWLVRVPKKWHAAEGVCLLREDREAFQDWARLYALYPGW